MIVRQKIPSETMPTPILTVNNLTVKYADAPALDDLTFEIARGDSVAIIGPNGAGKSTLIKTIMGLLQPQRGTTITLDTVKTPGYVPQHQDVNWEFPVTVEDVVMMGLARQIGWLRQPNRQHWQRVHAALERVGMAAYARQQIGELSGGQKQRVFIARALVQDVDMLLLDEPFAGVDVAAQAGLMEVIDDIHHAGITILLSTHDLSLAFHRFHTVMALNKRLIGMGNPDALYRSDVLRQLYGGAMFTMFEDNGRVAIFADEHGCC
jgi:ABC-type Mn2+/Zn2+ transport system ATPase subunit